MKGSSLTGYFPPTAWLRNRDAAPSQVCGDGLDCERLLALDADLYSQQELMCASGTEFENCSGTPLRSIYRTHWVGHKDRLDAEAEPEVGIPFS